MSVLESDVSRSPPRPVESKRHLRVRDSCSDTEASFVGQRIQVVELVLARR